MQVLPHLLPYELAALPPFSYFERLLNYILGARRWQDLSPERATKRLAHRELSSLQPNASR